MSGGVHIKLFTKADEGPGLALKLCLFTSNLEELDLLWYGKKREGSFPEEVPF